MSDFIKVNYKNGDSIVEHKNSLRLYSGLDGSYAASTLNCRLGSIFSVLSEEGSERLDIYNDIIDDIEITREEYDRLCKELGVE